MTWTEEIIEKYCVLTEDAKAGTPVQLMEWQRDLIRRSEGKRLVWLEIPRKNGKSAFIAMLAIAHLLKGWKDNSNPQVIIAAATREQAGILFGYVRNTILMNPVLKQALIPFRREIHLQGKPGFLKTITSDGLSNHGANPSLILCDEVHAWNEHKGPELWEALRTSMAARPSQMVAITTAGGAFTFAHKWHDYATKVLSGDIEDASFLPIIYGADDTEDPHSPEVWAKANPSLGVTVTYEYLQELSNTAKHDEPTLLSLRKLHLNQWAGSAQPYIELGTWNRCASKEPIGLANWRCYLGVDLAAVNDWTAYVLLFWDGADRFYTKQYYQITEHSMNKRKNKYPNLVRNWMKNGHVEVLPGEVNTTPDRVRRILEICDEWPVEAVFFDPWNAAETIDQVRQKFGAKFCFEVRQGVLMINEPMKLLYRLVQQRRIGHDGNPVTAWHISNTTLQIDKNDNWTFNKKNAPDKIDGTAALITALAGYVHNAQANTSVYQTEDIIFV
jgi:phage terminase large subunit-like protein